MLSKVITEWHLKPKKSRSVISASKDLQVGHHHAMQEELQKLGWETEFIIVNSVHALTEWLGQQQRRLPSRTTLKFALAFVVSRIASRTAIHSLLWPWLAREIVKARRPGVVYCQDSRIFRRRDLLWMKRRKILTVLQQDAVVPKRKLLSAYGAMVSCLQWFTNFATEVGIPALHMRLSFDPKMLSDRGGAKRDIDVSFVGSVTPAHPITIPLLRAIVQEVPGLQIYGPKSQSLMADPVLAPCYIGEAWGKDMLDVFLRSKVTLNRHGDVLGDEAGNYRLYEATACGAALVTDQLESLDDIFKVGEEVIAYRNPEEAAQNVSLLLRITELRETIAAAGQKRTESDHTIAQRMAQLSFFLSGQRISG